MLSASQNQVVETPVQVTTTDAYGPTTQRKFDWRGVEAGSIKIRNTGNANGAAVRLSGSLDGGQTFDVPIQAETILTPAASNALDGLYVVINDPFTDILLEVRSVATNATTTVESRALKAYGS